MFFKIFKNRFVFMINTLGFKFSFTAIMLLCLYNTLNICYTTRAHDISVLPAAEEVFVLKQGLKANDYLIIFYVFILLFPFCFSYIKEKRLHINPVIVSRTNQKKYYLANLLCSFLGAFLIFFIPFIIEMIINKFVFINGTNSLENLNYLSYGGGATITGDNIFTNTVSKGIPLQNLYINHRVIYNIIFSFLFSAFCGILSAFVYSISRFFYRFSIILFLPIYLLSFVQTKLDAIMDIKGVKYLNLCMEDYITIDSYFGKSYPYFWLLNLALLSIIIIIAVKSIKKDQLD